MNVFHLLLAGCVACSLTAQAQSQNPEVVQKILEHTDRGETVPLEVLDQADIQQNDVQAQIDIVLQQLLSMPFEMRQYVFPSLFDTPSVPKKIRTHPEIAVWEGKLPTRIAPQAQAYAEKYLKDMNPKLYVYLSPEAYKNNNSDVATEALPSDLGLAIKQAKSVVKVQDTGDKIEYRRVEEILKLPDELLKNPNKHIVTEEDIKKLRSGLNAFNTFLNDELQQNSSFRSGYRTLALFHTNAHDEKISPFQAKLDRLRLLKKDKELDEALKKSGWASADAFAIATDEMIRAYRAANMPLRFAFEANRYRGQTPKNGVEKLSVTMAKMYESLPADVYTIMKHMPQIRQDFIDTGYQSLLNAETVDEYRK